MKNRWKMMMAMLLSAGVANAAYVTIGGAGNSNDGTGNQNYGGVSYSYKISSTEVTIAQMAASGAGSGNENYWNTAGRTVGTSAPATMVTLYEAMKYCNYLTSGNVNDGVYTFVSGSYSSTMSRSAIMAGGLDSVATAASKIYALPTEDEWYKAAYYSVSGDSYSLYADGSDTTPTRGNGETGWSYGGYSTTRDTTHGSSEQNSTVNMNGNVWEWIEDSAGILRGASFNYSEPALRSSNRLGIGSSSEYNLVGFRPVEVVPEPATVGMLAISGLLIAGYRRFKKHYSL